MSVAREVAQWGPAERGPVVILRSVMTVIFGAVRTTTRPAVDHFRKHAYTMAGFASISTACFIHSIFTGFLVTGILFLAFEWKAADDED